MEEYERNEGDQDLIIQTNEKMYTECLAPSLLHALFDILKYLYDIFVITSWVILQI